MGDRRLVALATAPGHVLVQVRETSGHRLCHVTQLVPSDDVPLEVIREGALEEEAQGWGAGSGDRTGLAQPQEAVCTAGWPGSWEAGTNTQDA